MFDVLLLKLYREWIGWREGLKHKLIHNVSYINIYIYIYWIQTKLMQPALLFHHLLFNMFRMIVHPSSGACDLLWIYFMCCIALVRCVLVSRCGSAGVVWYPYVGWSTSACFIISLFTAQHVSNDSTSIFRSLRHIVDLFHVLYCSGSMCVGVTMWYPYAGWSTSASAYIRIPHHPRRTTP